MPLDTGPEGAALLPNGDILLLTRLNGTLRKHRRHTWWTSYATANEALPG